MMPTSLQASDRQATQLSESVNKSNQRQRDDVSFLWLHCFFILALFSFSGSFSVLDRFAFSALTTPAHTSVFYKDITIFDCSFHLVLISCQRLRHSLGRMVDARSCAVLLIILPPQLRLCLNGMQCGGVYTKGVCRC